MQKLSESQLDFLSAIKDPAASNGVSNLQRCRAAGYLTLAAVAKCLQAATWLVAHGNKRQTHRPALYPIMSIPDTYNDRITSRVSSYILATCSI